MTDTTGFRTPLQDAAQGFLDAYAAYLLIRHDEPPYDRDGQPDDPVAWDYWRLHENRPAYQAVNAALHELARRLAGTGYTMPDTNPAVVALCQAITAGNLFDAPEVSTVPHQTVRPVRSTSRSTLVSATLTEGAPSCPPVA